MVLVAPIQTGNALWGRNRVRGDWFVGGSCSLTERLRATAGSIPSADWLLPKVQILKTSA